jgi:metal-responsive CopG/Arc/MetJ family transcriptional regulator
MKTALSIPDEIFREVEKFAKEHHFSRSEVFVIAVKEFLKKLESKKLLDALNNAYSDVESPEEKTLRVKSKKYYINRVLKNNIDN